MTENAVVFVTGGTGLAGNGIRLHLEAEASAGREGGAMLAKWIYCCSKDGDLRDKAATRALFEKHRPTHVVHCAALVGGLFKNMKYKVEFMSQNLSINTNVVECCYEFGVRRLVCLASTCVFPAKCDWPVDETQMHAGPPHPSNEGYAHAKRLLDVNCRLHNEQFGTDYVTLIPTNMFGPFDNFNLEDGHVLAGLIHKCHRAKTDGTAYTIWGSGSPLRQFIFNKDLGRLVVWALFESVSLDSEARNESLILAPDEAEEISIKDLAILIAEAMEFKGEMVFDTTKSDGMFKKTASNARLRKRLPDFAFTPIGTAVCETVAWFVDNLEAARLDEKPPPK